MRVFGHGLAEIVFTEFQPGCAGNGDVDGVSVGIGCRFGNGPSEFDADLGQPIEPAATRDHALDHGLKGSLDVRDDGFTKEESPLQGIGVETGEFVDIVHG